MKLKKYHIFRQLISVILSVALLFNLLSCNVKKVGPTAPTDLTTTITGKVIDSHTDLGIPDVRIEVVGFSIVATDNDGVFIFNDAPKGNLSLIASKEGYIKATRSLDATEIITPVNQISLTPLPPPVIIGQEGGSIEASDAEGDIIKLEIPEGALSEDVGISVMPLQGLEIPGTPPEGYLSIATAHFEPEGLSFEKPVSIEFPLSFSFNTESELELFSLNTDNTWEKTDIKAIVSEDSLKAITYVNHFSTYSVMQEVIIEDEIISETQIERTYEIHERQKYLEISFKNEISFSDATPGLDTLALTYMIEQYTGLSFTEPSIFIIPIPKMVLAIPLPNKTGAPNPEIDEPITITVTAILVWVVKVVAGAVIGYFTIVFLEWVMSQGGSN
ncbi:MAG: carboxypeptidase-like regulatory domain-containing protein [Candidatus Hatepunaea meridiana]|nr:carboxypeptidase-like regulatory domain-containing protein [Candidatus Hatepunaea meridiana]